MHDFYEDEKTYDRCGLMSLCFLCVKTFMYKFYDIENTTTDAAQCRFGFVVHDRCGPMSLCFLCVKTFMYKLYDIENTTTDAAQCRFAFVVHDRCRPMSLCFRCARPMRPNVSLLSLCKDVHV
jgi:hypothetical protein